MQPQQCVTGKKANIHPSHHDYSGSESSGTDRRSSGVAGDQTGVVGIFEMLIVIDE